MTITSAESACLSGGLEGRDAVKAGRPRRRSRRVAADVVGFLDVAAVVAGGMIPALIYATAGGLPIDWMKHLQMNLVVAIIVYGCLRHYGMYDTERMHNFPIVPGRLATSLGIALVAVLGMGLPFAPQEMHLWIWYGAWMSTSFMLLLGVRLFAHGILRRMTRAGAFDERVAVYGSGTVARRVEAHLRNPELGVSFAGVFDDRSDAKRVDAEGPSLAGRLDDLVEAARSGGVDRIIIALPQAADQRTVGIARRLEHLPASLHVVTHIASDLVESGPAHKVSNLGSVGLIDVKSKPLADWDKLIKLAEDYVLGTLLFIVALPLMALIALIVRIDSQGPIIFRQRRRGLNHEVFEVLKFRTMHVVEDHGDLKQATRDDPRVTRVGRFLRRYSLDELPQIVNVLRGEMSLVGPRPHAVSHDDHFGETVARYANRQQVKPGITGLAQVSGERGETETQEKIERRLALDLIYVNTWSLWLDLKILLMTVVRVLGAKNAY